jgi:hypothetical protein
MPGSLHQTLAALFGELVDGPAAAAAWMLNPGDEGLLRALDKLTADAASSVSPAGGASIAAHVDHVRYGLSLMNRWAGGEANPWATADWAASWTKSRVDDREWAARRGELAAEVRAWKKVLATPREYSELELSGVIASVAHLAYHLGAIRQIDRSIRGPAAS